MKHEWRYVFLPVARAQRVSAAKVAAVFPDADNDGNVPLHAIAKGIGVKQITSGHLLTASHVMSHVAGATGFGPEHCRELMRRMRQGGVIHSLTSSGAVVFEWTTVFRVDDYLETHVSSVSGNRASKLRAADAANPKKRGAILDIKKL